MHFCRPDFYVSRSPLFRGRDLLRGPALIQPGANWLVPMMKLSTNSAAQCSCRRMLQNLHYGFDSQLKPIAMEVYSS